MREMNIKLTPEQIDELRKDSFLNIDLGNGATMYFEFNTDSTFLYGEIYDSNSNIGKDKRKTYVFDCEALSKIKPTKPDDPSWYHNDPLCPTCGTYMIYKFECCPRCGQALDWRDRSE